MPLHCFVYSTNPRVWIVVINKINRNDSKADIEKDSQNSLLLLT